MLNFETMFKAKKARETFMNNHPKVQPFLDEIQEKGLCEDAEIAIAVRYPDGTEYKTGIRVTESDLEMLEMLFAIM